MLRLVCTALALLALCWAVLTASTAPTRAELRWTHSLRLTAHMKEMGGGGDALIDMKFTTPALCKSFRRAIWSQMAGLDGDLGNCIVIADIR